jgi:uncharacterized paraquat-inducible protein A
MNKPALFKGTHALSTLVVVCGSSSSKHVSYVVSMPKIWVPYIKLISCVFLLAQVDKAIMKTKKPMLNFLHWQENCNSNQKYLGSWHTIPPP